MLNPLLFNINISKAVIQPLDLRVFTGRNIAISMLRLDLIHPEISGNKWFKLQYHLEKFHNGGYKGLVTFGGAWSNHLLATAETCRVSGIPCAAIIRGERPEKLSPVLKDLMAKNMQIHFVSRAEFSLKRFAMAEALFPGYYQVPEGGAGNLGIKGAGEIMKLIPEYATHIACAFGTGTMLAGLTKNTNKHQNILGFSSLKIQPKNDIEAMVAENSPYGNYRFFYDYHFGGYGKTKPGLLEFMDAFYKATGIELDRVYTGKMVLGMVEELKKGFFPEDARIVMIHSGGLSGNRNL